MASTMLVPGASIGTSAGDAPARSNLGIASRAALAAAAGTIVLFSYVEASPATLITFGLFLTGGLMITRRQGATAAGLFLMSYSACAVAAVALYMIYLNRYGTPYYVGGSDDLAYELWAQSAATSLGIFDYGSIRGGVVQPTHNSVGYIYLVSLLYRLGEMLGGFHTLIPRLFNGLCLGLTSVVTYRVARRLRLADGTAVAAALFTGLLPIMVYNASHTFRELPAALLILTGIYVWTPDRESPGPSKRIWRWAVTIVLVLILSEVRFFQALVLLAVAFVADTVVPRGSPGRRQQIYAFFAVILAAGVLWYMRSDILALVERLASAQDRYASYRADLSDGLSYYVFTAPLPLGYVLRIGYALISPLPVLSRDPDRLLLSLGTIVHYAFLPFLGFGVWLSARQRFLWPLLGAFLALFGGMAFLTFTARHIVQFVPCGVLLAAAGYEKHGRYRVPIWLLMGWLGALLGVVYVMLKQ